VNKQVELYWERIEKDGRDLEHHLEDIIRATRDPKERLQYEEWIDGVREIRQEAHKNAHDIAVEEVEHLGIEASSQHNPVDWHEVALIHELEGGKPIVALVKRVKRGKTYMVKSIPRLVIVTQDENRREIPEQVCRELQEAGFKTDIGQYDRGVDCYLSRAEEVIYATRQMLPHYRSKDTIERMTKFLEDAEKVKPTRPRIKFEPHEI